MKNLILLFTIIFTLPTLACDDVNLYRDTDRIWDLPIENQGEMNTCYSHTLSTIYNLSRPSNDENLNVYWSAFIHKNKFIHWSPKNMDYSLLSWAWSDMVKSGICDANIVRKNLEQVKNGVNYSDDQLMYLLKTYFKSKFWRGSRSDARYQRSLNALMKNLNKIPEGFERPWIVSEVRTIIDEIRHEARGNGFFQFLNQHVFAECKGHKNPAQGILYWTGRGRQTNDWMANHIGARLSEHRAVGIGYCPKVVHEQNPATSKDVSVMPRVLKAANTRCGAHYATLVGSRPKGQSCEYLLRNTYTDDFWAHESIECWCLDKTTGEQRNCRKNADQGKVKVLGCWMAKDKLMTNIYDVSYF
jgi:hypothetical protein